jgi:hypothetical protein
LNSPSISGTDFAELGRDKQTSNKLEEVMSLIWEFITNHKHYWGVPHKCGDQTEKVVMICYGCGKIKDVKADICPRF